MKAGAIRSDRARLARAVVPVVAALALAAIAFVIVERIAFLNYVERFVEDWETAALLPAAPQDPDVVVVAITDESLSAFPYSAPVDRVFLSGLLETLAARAPRAIGLDLLLTQPTEPAKDELLRQTLDGLTTPLVVSYADEDDIFSSAQRRSLDAFVPPRLRGLSALGNDQFDTVRWIVPGHAGTDGRFIPSFDAALAAAAGAPVQSDLIALVWHGRPASAIRPFREIPAAFVATVPSDWLKDKVVLVGTVSDAHRTPFATVFGRSQGMLPAVEIHANGVAQLLHGTRSPEIGAWRNFAIVVVAAGLGAALGLVGWPLSLRLGAGLLVVLAMWIGGAAFFHYADIMAPPVAPTLALGLSLFAMEAFSGREARRQREFITGAFSCYVSPKVVEALIRDPARMTLEGERRTMTYLFTDIANFTAMSEALDSHDLARTLNGYFDGLTDIVLGYDGTIGKFEGDAVFVIFNAPMDQPDHAERAVRCALDIDRYAQAYSAAQQEKTIPFGHTRIGVHTGPAVVGNFGSRRRFDYSAQGDAVNTAARLEGVNKQFETRICISAATRALCQGIAFRPLGSVVVKGKTAGIAVWEPMREDSAWLARYREAYAKLEEGAAEAPALFAALNRDNPGDRCVALHLERLGRGERGVELVLTEK